MKRVILFYFFSFIIVNSIISQVEFGATGSFWNYTYYSHNGNGGGWDVLFIEGDTIIDNETLKILKRDYYRYSSIPFEEYYGSSLVGLMKITDDSIFVNDNLILDFNMQTEDSLLLLTSVGATIQLAIDSIKIEEINAIEYKKWYGQQLCVQGDDLFPYEEFTIIENVGQVGYFDYLLWNTDGCIIGGGGRGFVCHGNGDFTYPPNSQCNQYMIVDTKEIDLLEEIRIYPNPSLNSLNIENDNLQIQLISVYDFTGRKVLQEGTCNGTPCRLNLEPLIPGIYIIEINTNKGNHLDKFIKK